MAFPVRAPRTTTEYVRMLAQADELRAQGALDDALVLESLLRGFRPDPESIAIGNLLRGMSGIEAPAPTRLYGLEVPPAPGRLDDMDGPTLQAMDKSVRSYEALRSGRTGNLRNQERAQPAGAAIRDAAQDFFRKHQEAAAAERMMQAGAIAGATGLGAMIAESTGRGDRPVPTTANLPTAPRTAAQLHDISIPDVDMELPDVPMPVDPYSYETNIPTEADPFADDMLLDDEPMATADLVAEARPVPASTPKVERLTPEEIAALRSQVVAIRDAQTGEAMDSFYPPESEEYKREQMMKQRYPQLRRR